MPPFAQVQYVFQLQTSASVALVDDEDVNDKNDNAMSPR
jgi:hypothetical protein